MVPTSDFESGGSSREMVSVVDVGWTLGASTDEPVNARTWTVEFDASAAPTGSKLAAEFHWREKIHTINICVKWLSNVFSTIFCCNEAYQTSPALIEVVSNLELIPNPKGHPYRRHSS